MTRSRVCASDINEKQRKIRKRPIRHRETQKGALPVYLAILFLTA
jgi:hypothetical protein